MVAVLQRTAQHTTDAFCGKRLWLVPICHGRDAVEEGPMSWMAFRSRPGTLLSRCCVEKVATVPPEMERFFLGHARDHVDPVLW